MTELGIALLGLGNVGRSSWELLSSHADDIARRLGAKVVVKKALVRDAKKPRGVPEGLLTTDVDAIFADTSVQVVVELLGGTQLARTLALRAIDSGRQLVTANKALLSEYGEEIFSRAQKRGVDVCFEGAVCGGIPVIRTLREALASDRVEGLYGIVNGTTNLILTAMAEEGRSYAEALAEAQAKGFAEADPTLDVSGMDAAQKLQLLAQLAFGARLSAKQVEVDGIVSLAPVDFAMAREFGFVLKLLAVARRQGSALDARVAPTFIPKDSPLSQVRGAFNAVMIESAALGSSLLYGQGAGGSATASAVVSDVIDVCRNLLSGSTGRVPMLCAPHLSDTAVLGPAERVGRAYLRFSVADEPGVLGQIATVLGEKSVSIEALVQRPAQPGQSGATIAVLTHAAKESDLMAALSWIDGLKSTRAKTQRIRIEVPGASAA